MEDAIQKMTLIPAIKMNFKNRGVIAEGYKADITIFDPEKIIDTSTLINPHCYPVGIKYISADPSICTGVAAIQAGAVDYFPLDYWPEELLQAIKAILLKRCQLQDSDQYSKTCFTPVVFDGMIYRNDTMKAIVSMIDQIAPSKATVLLLGESGVDKEALAKMIHQKSLRKDNRFVVINCAAIPEHLIESELFGHEKGSFTGANFQRIGKFEQAQGGTVFLDEMGELSLEMQVKFLRVLQEKQLEGECPGTPERHRASDCHCQ